MLIAEDNALNVKTKQQKYTDARMYAAVPFRAATDRRLSLNDLRVLMLVCGYLKRGTQVSQPSQETMAAALGCVHTLVYRHVQRLVKFGYLVQLAPKVRQKLCTIYGVVFDPERPPVRNDVSKYSLTYEEEERNSVSERSLTSSYQPVARQVVKQSDLMVAWRKLVVGYIPNELEQKHFVELSRLGADASYLERIHVKGRDLIGYYMAQARQELGAL